MKVQNRRPFVSVVVPAYNAELTVCECIEALLNQSLCNEGYEVIVIDNNSSDDTARLINSYPEIRYEFEAVKGPASARNRGLYVARGEIIAFTDADCVPSKTWLEDITRPFQNSDCDICGG